MGWTARNLNGRSVEAEIRKEFGSHEVEQYIDSQPAYDGQNAAYVVVIRPDGYRYAAVILYENRPGRFGFATKIMEAVMGPYYYDMPVSWLDLLPEPDGSSEVAWREKVRAQSRNGGRRAA